jgi:hypothetical protein
MKRFGFSLACALVLACTDNGATTHGPTFGAFPEREGGTEPGPGEETDGGPTEADAGGDAAACSAGSVALLAGGSSTLVGAIQDRNGPFTASALGSATVSSKPALVAFGTGFLGVSRDANDALRSVRYTSSWSAPETIGVAGVKGAPSLAVNGTTALVVYSAGAGSDRFFWSGTHDGNGWDAASTRVSADGTQPNQSYGTVSGGLASAGSEIVFAENGTNEKLYVRPFVSATWGAAKQVAQSDTMGGSLEATPELVAHDGAFDLAVVYVRKTTRQFAYATRATANNPNGDWVDGGIFDPLATTAEKFSVARISPTLIVVAFRGQDGNGYLTGGTISGTTITWTPAQPIGGAVTSTPAVAKGVCGDTAVIAFAQGGSIKVTRLRGASWSTPETVPNAFGTHVAIATR